MSGIYMTACIDSLLFLSVAYALITRVRTKTLFLRYQSPCLPYATNLHDDLYCDHACLAQRSFSLIFWLACFCCISSCFQLSPGETGSGSEGYKWKELGGYLYGNSRQGGWSVVSIGLTGLDLCVREQGNS
jgi:hypothetical protein